MSTLRVNSLQNTSGQEMYTAKAWVNFNGTGTVAIRASGNVSSITDNGVGSYTVNFTTAMPDANYAVVGGSNGTSVANYGAIELYTGASVASVRAYRTDTQALADLPSIFVAIFR